MNIVMNSFPFSCFLFQWFRGFPASGDLFGAAQAPDARVYDLQITTFQIFPIAFSHQYFGFHSFYFFFLSPFYVLFEGMVYCILCCTTPHFSFFFFPFCSFFMILSALHLVCPHDGGSGSAAPLVSVRHE